MSRRLVLASASPRRVEILRTLGFEFDVRPVDFDETPRPGEAPEALVARLALGKASEAARRGPAGAAYLGADTVVVAAGRVLGKPTDDREARAMLRELSGRTHQVLTGIALVLDARTDLDVVHTDVTFGVLDDATIDDYVASGEGRDKAGSYALQGRAMAFAAKVHGSASSVVGLPGHETARLLERHGIVATWRARRGGT